jgi:uncharacterized protein YjbI with pentapeptide repeats
MTPSGPQATTCSSAMTAGGADVLLAASDWLDSEKWAWEKLRAGFTADFNVKFGVLEASKADGWTSARELRPCFIESLLEIEPYRSALPNLGLHVVGAWIRDPMSLGRRRLQHACRVEHSRFEANVSLRSMRSIDDISFRKSVFCSALDIADARVDGTVDLSGAVVCGEFDLQRAQVADQLNLEHAHFEGKVIVERARIGGQFYGLDIVCSGELAMDGIRVGGALSMKAGVCHQVSMKHAKVDGHIDFSHLKCSQSLDAEGCEIGSDLFLSNAELNELALIGAKVGGQLTLSSTSCSGACDLEAVDVHGDIFLRHCALETLSLIGGVTGGQVVMDGISCKGEASLEGFRVGTDLIVEDNAKMDSVDLVGATIGGDVKIADVCFSGELDLTGISVAASLQMVRITTNKRVNLNRAKCRVLNLSGARIADIDLRFADIEDLANLTGTIVDGVLDMEMITIGGNLFLRDRAKFGRVYLWDANVRGTIEARGAVFNELFDMNGVRAGFIWLQGDARFNDGIKLTNARVEQSIELAGAHFRGPVDLTGGEIGSSLIVSSSERGRATWDACAELILQNTTVDTVQVGISEEMATGDCWPERLQLNGFRYRRLSKPYPSTERKPIRDSDGFIRWLARDWRPSNQPYQQLARALIDCGDLDEAERVLFAGQERKREGARGIRRVGYEVLKWTIGYGIGARYFLSLAWVLAITIVGGIVFAPFVRSHWSGHGAQFLFSVDQLLPIVHVTPAAEDLAKQISGWQSWYLAFHRMCGFVLGSFIVAGLTGITKE